ncbi:MAG: nucleotidyltransferase domain-containing protein, partial [Candidatus Dormibacteraceae bacterium]
SLPGGGVPLGEVVWEPWSPNEVADRLAGLDVSWAIAAGWALDLFRGTVSRVHEDIEVAIPAGDFGMVRQALAPDEFDLVGGGLRWSVGDQHALALTHQTWLRQPATGVYRLDVFREPHEGATWICRRERSLRLPYATLIRRTAEGLPYIAPEVALLFKARSMRPKDVQDFAGALPLLDATSREWLVTALTLVHPGHEWISRLGGQ